MAKVACANFCRFLLAVVFVFSGFVKAVDPLGTFYKIQDYVAAFGMSGWIPAHVPLLMSVLLAATEFCVGAFLLFGVRRRISTGLALLLMVCMTPLTFYLAVANPVSDCGCFGDAVVLTNWQTFWKNVVLLVAAAVVFKWKRLIVRFVTLKVEWMVSMYTLVFIFALSFYCLRHLPVLDFRPFKVGVNIKEAMTVPPGEKPTEYETVFVLEKDGQRKEFTLENYPDSTWTFVKADTRIRQKGYEPPIQEFSMVDMETGEDIADAVLSDPGYSFLLVAYQLDVADDSNIDLINEIYDYSVDRGYGFYALTSSSMEGVERWCDMTGAEYKFYRGEDVTLKTIVRSNPGLLLLKDGVILKKWSDNDLPDEYVLHDSLDKLPVGQLKTETMAHALARVMLWFAAPLLFILCLDLLFRPKKQGKLTKSPSTPQT